MSRPDADSNEAAGGADPVEPLHEQPGQQGGEDQPRRGRFQRWVLPVLVPTGIFLAAGQARQASNEIKSALAAAREASARRRADTRLKPVAVRLPDGEVRYLATDPAERFEQLYECFDWTEPYRQGQIRGARRAKFACLLMGLVSVFACLALLINVQSGLAVLFVPVTMLVLTLTGMMGFRWALIQYQYTSRSLVRATTFLAQKDFFRWMLS